MTCADPATLPGGYNFGIPAMQPGAYYLLVQAFTSGSEGTVDLRLRGVAQRVLEICDNGIDDDGDGAIDCNDRKCATDESCTKLRCRADKQLGLLAIDGTTASVAVQTSGAGNDQTKSTCVSAPTGADTVVGFSLPGKTEAHFDRTMHSRRGHGYRSKQSTSGGGEFPTVALAIQPRTVSVAQPLTA